MIIRVCTAIVASAALLSPAIAAEELTAQQQRMKTCNLQAKDKDLKGDQHQSCHCCCNGSGEGNMSKWKNRRACRHAAILFFVRAVYT